MEQLYKREAYLEKIRPFYDLPDVIKVLTGVRRCGKSCIMEMIREELVGKGVPDRNLLYIHLDRRPYKGIRTPDKLEEAIDKGFSDASGLKYLFIDEIQNVKNFEEVVNAYREEGDYSIFVTGSNGYLLSGQLVTKLTGRYLEFEIHTLSFKEYEEMKAQYGKPIDPNLDTEFASYVVEGGFPLTVRIDEGEAKRAYVKGVIEEIYEKDIKKNKKIRQRALFDTIQTYIVNNFGATTSLKALCGRLESALGRKVRKETVYNYLQILQDAKIVLKCRRFDLKSKRSLNGEEKYYLSDLSFYFASNVDNRINYGPVLENIVYRYARMMGYEASVGRIGNLEVDFILRDQRQDYAYVQVAQTIMAGPVNEKGVPLTEEREYRPLESIKDNYPKYLLTMDHLLQKRNGIKHENIVAFLKEEKAFQ